MLVKRTFGRSEFHYWAEFKNNPIALKPGAYWLGVRHPTPDGSGTNYWTTSDGGPDGGDSSTGFFSLDSGNTWMPEGDIWHHAFVIGGREVRCNPCDMDCDGSVDLSDIESFIHLLLGDEPCNYCTGDTNDDGSVDLTDVEGFIECLLG